MGTAVTLGTLIVNILLSEIAASSRVLLRRKSIEELTALEGVRPSKELPVVLSLSPQTKTINVGDTFDVQVKLNTNTVGVSVIQAVLNYSYANSPELEVKDADGEEANGIQIKAGRLKGLKYITNEATVNRDLNRVTINLSAIVSNPAGVFKTKKEIIFGTISFKAKEPSDSITLSFDQESSRVISDISGENILSSPINGNYVIK